MNVNTILNSNTGESGNSLWIAFGSGRAGVIAIDALACQAIERKLCYFVQPQQLLTVKTGCVQQAFSACLCGELLLLKNGNLA